LTGALDTTTNGIAADDAGSQVQKPKEKIHVSISVEIHYQDDVNYSLVTSHTAQISTK